MDVLKDNIESEFHYRGFILSEEALDVAVSFANLTAKFLADVFETKMPELCAELMVTGQTMRKLVEAYKSLHNIEFPQLISDTPPTERLLIINVFDVGRYVFSELSGQFIKIDNDKPCTMEDLAEQDRAKEVELMLIARFNLLLQTHYLDECLPVGETTERMPEITYLRSLPKCSGTTWTMGILCRYSEKLYLESLGNSVEIDISNTLISSGFYMPGTIVLAEGVMLPTGVFEISRLGFPSLEGRGTSLFVHKGVDFFGCGLTEVTLDEEDATNDILVILSDIWLDKKEVWENLKVVFHCYNCNVKIPALFVLMGNFSSYSLSPDSILIKQFEELGKVIGAYPKIKAKSRFLFIPGPDDPGSSNVLPRYPLADDLFKGFRKHMPSLYAPSNPCRVKFNNKTIVIFRQDILKKMLKSCLIPPPTSSTNFGNLVATITQQRHLCPMPMDEQPVFMNYDHTLQLYPSPHTIILGDTYEPECIEFGGITCFNTGSFARGGAFSTYCTTTDKVELQTIGGGSGKDG